MKAEQICIMTSAIILLTVPDFHNTTEGIKGNYIYRVNKKKYRQRETVLLSELKITQRRTQKKEISTAALLVGL